MHLRTMKRFLLIAMVLFVPFAKAQAVEPVHVVIIGDSLMSGYMLRPGEDFGSVLERQLLSQRYNAKVINLSVAGITTEEALRNMDRVFAAQPDIAIIELGMNDALRGLDVQGVIYANLHKIRFQLVNRKIPYIIVGVNAPSSRDAAYARKLQSVYYSLANYFKAPLVPNLLAPLQGKPEWSLADGMHPNAEGTKAMVALVMPKVLPLVSWSMRSKAYSAQ